MERRFTVRYREMMDEAVVRPDSFGGIVERLEEFVKPFADSLIRSEQRQHAWEYVAGLLSDLTAEKHGNDRLSARAGSSALAEVHRTDEVGPQALDRRTGPAGRRGVGRSRRRVGVRSVGLSQAGTELGGRGPAVVRSTRQNRQLPGGHLHGLCLAEGTGLGGLPLVSAQGVVPR